MRIAGIPSYEPRADDATERAPPPRNDRRDAPAGTWQAAQAERQRQSASHAPAPRRPEPAAEPRRGMSAPAPPNACTPGRVDADTPPLWRPVDARAGHERGGGGGSGGSGGSGGRHGREEGGAVVADASGARAAADDGQVDDDLLAERIAHQAAAPGQELFELLLPGGEKLGVLLAPGADRVLRILLSCSDDGLRRELDGKRMELERGLAQRMGQATCVAVL